MIRGTWLPDPQSHVVNGDSLNRLATVLNRRQFEEAVHLAELKDLRGKGNEILVCSTGQPCMVASERLG